MIASPTPRPSAAPSRRRGFAPADVWAAAAAELSEAVEIELSEGEVRERLQEALRGGDVRIERRDAGWVVIDRYGSFLCDVGGAAWAVDDSQVDLPLPFFETAENASRAYLQSERIAELRAQRDALRKLGRARGTTSVLFPGRGTTTNRVFSMSFATA